MGQPDPRAPLPPILLRTSRIFVIQEPFNLKGHLANERPVAATRIASLRNSRVSKLSPAAIGINSTTNRIYVVDSGDNTVSVFDRGSKRRRDETSMAIRCRTFSGATHKRAGTQCD
jgi:DNA-binding beta-propeller fold protein YncE